MKSKKEKINEAKVSMFFHSLTEAEFIYVGHVHDISQMIRDMIKKYNLSQKRFCELFGLKSPAAYHTYVSGSRRYDIEDLATIYAIRNQLEQEALVEAQNKREGVKFEDA